MSASTCGGMLCCLPAMQDHLQQSALKEHLTLVNFDYHHHISSANKLEKLESILYRQTKRFLLGNGLFLRQRGVVHG